MDLSLLPPRIRKFVEIAERIIKYHPKANDPLFWFNSFYYGKGSPVYVCWSYVQSGNYYSVTPCPTLPKHKDDWNKYDFEIQIHLNTVNLNTNGKTILQIFNSVHGELLGSEEHKSSDSKK